MSMIESDEGLTNGGDIGARIRGLRKKRDLTLIQLSDLCGVSRAALSKIERSEISPTYSTLRKIGIGLELTIAQMLAPTSGKTHIDYEVIRSEGAASEDAMNNSYRLLAGANANTSVRCFVSEVRTTSAQPDDFHTHQTEDTVFVLEGSITFHRMGYPPTTLNKGDSLFYGGETPHTFTRNSERQSDEGHENDKPPEALWISRAMGPEY